MPCNDITDLLKVRLDDDNLITGYQLSKRTCGAAVGGYELIGPWLVGQNAHEFIETPADDFLEKNPPRDETHEFLLLKHFFSVKNGLEVLLGQESGKRTDKCAIDSVEYGPDGLEFMASIRLEIVSKQIKACESCKLCK